jgi:DNA-binding response OmpR family regulator
METHVTEAEEQDDTPVIVYVDDDLELTRLVQGFLEDEGYHVITANDGEQGLETIIVEQPDLVILDVMMPGLTGWDITRYLRSKKAFEDLPVLMLTGVGERMNAMMAPLYGASAYLDKPFDVDELGAVVRRLLEGEETA